MTLNKIINVGILLGVLILAILPYEILFGSSESHCLLFLTTGLECPGCGMTRALYFFIHLDWMNSLKMNFAVVGLVVFLAAYFFKNYFFNPSDRQAGKTISKFYFHAKALFSFLIILKFSYNLYFFFT